MVADLMTVHMQFLRKKNFSMALSLRMLLVCRSHRLSLIYPSFLNRSHNHASIITVFEEPVLTLFEHNITAARRYENIKSVAILNDVYMSGQGVSIR